MPMNAAGMAGEILTLVKTVNPDLGAAEESIILPLLEKMCEGLIAHIVANAQVTVNVSGGSSSGPHVGVIA